MHHTHLHSSIKTVLSRTGSPTSRRAKHGLTSLTPTNFARSFQIWMASSRHSTAGPCRGTSLDKTAARLAQQAGGTTTSTHGSLAGGARPPARGRPATAGMPGTPRHLCLSSKWRSAEQLRPYLQAGEATSTFTQGAQSALWLSDGCLDGCGSQVSECDHLRTPVPFLVLLPLVLQPARLLAVFAV